MWALEPVRWESLGCWDDYRCHEDSLLGWALGSVGVVWGYWGDWDLLGNGVSGAIMGRTGVVGDSVEGVLRSLGLWGGYWNRRTPRLE